MNVNVPEVISRVNWHCFVSSKIPSEWKWTHNVRGLSSKYITHITYLKYFVKQRSGNPHCSVRGGSCSQILFGTIIRMYYVLMSKHAAILSDSYVFSVARFGKPLQHQSPTYTISNERRYHGTVLLTSLVWRNVMMQEYRTCSSAKVFN